MEKLKKKNLPLYVGGSLALTAGACFTIPKIIDKLATIIYKQNTMENQPQTVNVEWEPEVIYKKKESVNDDENV